MCGCVGVCDKQIADSLFILHHHCCLTVCFSISHLLPFLKASKRGEMFVRDFNWKFIYNIA